MVALPFPEDASYLTVAEVASLLRVDPKTIRRWIASHDLDAVRVGRNWRIARATLRDHLEIHGDRAIAGVL